MTDTPPSRSSFIRQHSELGSAGSGGPVRRPAPPASDGIRVAELRDVIRQNLLFILVVAGCLSALVVGATLVSRMEFRASGRLYLGELASSARSAAASSEEIDLSGGARADVGSEIEIMTSRSLVSRAILESGLNVAVQRAGSAPVRYLEWLLSGRDGALLDRAAQELTASATSLSGSVGRARQYAIRFSSDSEYELSSADFSARSGELGRGRLGEALDVGELTLTLEPGLTRRPEPGSVYEMTVAPMEETIERVLGVLDVSAAKPAGSGEPAKVVTLRFAEASPLLAARFLRRLMLGYLEQRQAWKTENASAAEAFVTRQLTGMKSSLEQIEEKLAAYRSSNSVVVLDDDGKAMAEQIGKYEGQRVAARLQVAELAHIQGALQDPNPPVEAYLFGEANDTVLEGLAASLSRARQELTDLEARFNPSAPDVREQRAQVDAQLDAIRSYTTTRLRRSQQNLDSLNGIIAQFEKKLRSVPGAELALAQLARESEVYGRLYSYLLERQQQTAIVKASTVSQNRILDEPEVAHREASPRLALRLASLPLGVLIGVALVLVRGFFSGRLSGEGDVRSSIGALPVFASVPRRRGPRGRPRSAAPEPIFDPEGDVDPGFVEAFRTLRTSLYGALPGGGVVLITSPCSGDGKTTCALGLASLLVADRMRVLVVDADLRAPTHHALWGAAGYMLPAARDLGAALDGSLRLRDAVWHTRLATGQCHTLGAREPLSVELLSSKGMRRLLDDARPAYDFLLLDAPSVPKVSDALVLGPRADFLLSVLRPQHTSRALTEQHLERLYALDKSHGVLINHIIPGRRMARTRPAQAPPKRQRSLTACIDENARDVDANGRGVDGEPGLVPDVFRGRGR